MPVWRAWGDGDGGALEAAGAFFAGWQAVVHFAEGRGWLGQRTPPSLWPRALLATLAEPFSFQLLRHLGASWGWISVITGRLDWAPQRQPGAGT